MSDEETVKAEGLIGPNSAGKTTIINKLTFVKMALDLSYVGIFTAVMGTISIFLPWRFLSK